MKQRHSRFNRIYHRLTRRVPDRARQMQQIGRVRGQGSLGWTPAAASRPAYVDRAARAPRGDPPADPQSVGHSENEWKLLPERPTTEPEARSASRALVAIAVCTAVLACAYSGLSGYRYAWGDTFSWAAVLGTIASFITAGLCIRAAVAPLNRATDGRLLYASCAFLACLYIALLACWVR